MAVPRVGRHLIHRPRLLARMAAHTPLTVLRAPTGFGKTTLVLQSLEHHDAAEGPVAWARVRRDADTTAFWLTVADALGDAGLARPSLSDRHTPYAAVERMLAAAPAPVLVVDGLHNATDERIDQQLVELLWDVPQLRLIVCIRDHRPELSAPSIDLEVTTVTAPDLLFTPEEVGELFHQLGVEVGADEVAAAHAATGGWPEPTKLLGQRLRSPSLPHEVSALAGEVAADYLQRRLTPEIPDPDLLMFALATALPAEFTVAMAEWLTGDAAAKAHSVCLAREGLLLAEPVSRREAVYRWPGAARQALLAELRRCSPGKLPVLHSRLARHYFSADRPSLAIEHAVRGEDWPLVVEVIGAAWQWLLLHDHERLIDAVIATPLHAIAQDARALAVREILLTGAEGHLTAVARLPKAQDDLAGLGRRADVHDVLDTGLAVILALRRRGLIARAKEHAEAVQQVAAAARASRPTEVFQLLPVIDMEVAVTRLIADDLAGTYPPLRRAYTRARDSVHDHVQADAASSLALVHALNGESPESSDWLQRLAGARSPTGSIVPVIRDKKTVARLLNALDRLDLAAADSAAEEFADDPGANEFWFLNVYAQAQHALHTGAYADALENIDRSRLAYRDWLTEAATADPLLRATEADLLMAMGRGHQARSVLEDARVDHPLLRVSQARLALFSGQPATALELGRDSGWMRRATARHRLEMLVIKAIAADRLGDRGSALHALRRALGEARALDARRPFVMVRRTDLAALAGCEARLAELLDEPAVRRHPDLFPVELVLVQLTEREARVLEKLAEGLTLQQVADALVVSYNTVKTQQRSLFRRLGAPTRADAIARARQWGLL